MMFWIAAALLVLVCVTLVLAPMLRGSGSVERRASYDLQIYRDQIREVERDVQRGVVTPEEADATRTEIARKLLAAAEAEKREAAAGRAPRRTSLLGGALTGAAALGMTALLYWSQGAPGHPDQPLAERIAQARAAAEESARTVERLELVLAQRPDDVQGHRFLVQELVRLGRIEEAAAAQTRVIDLLGESAEARDHLALAQLEFGAAGGQVSPEAEAALDATLAREPTNPLARYLRGVKLLQDGRPEETHAIWSDLLKEGPPDAPWIRAIDEEIEAVAAEAAQKADEASAIRRTASSESKPEGTVSLGIASPERLSAASPQATTSVPAQIDTMVESLAERLAREGGPAEDWSQLIRSLGVLGRIAEASAVFEEARTAFASDPSALATVTAAAREARLVQ